MILHEEVVLTFVPQLLTLSAVFLLACISPGPDFIAVTSNALADRRRGLGVAVGVVIACTIWATLAMFGLGLLLTRVAPLYEAVRLGGAAYLLYLGVKMLLGARRPAADVQVAATRNARGSAVRTGLMVGMTNPKSAAFFGSLFVTILPADSPLLIQGAAVAIVTVIALGWFCLLALLFSVSRVRSTYATLRRPIDALTGTILIGLGLRLATIR